MQNRLFPGRRGKKKGEGGKGAAMVISISASAVKGVTAHRILFAVGAEGKKEKKKGGGGMTADPAALHNLSRRGQGRQKSFRLLSPITILGERGKEGGAAVWRRWGGSLRRRPTMGQTVVLTA